MKRGILSIVLALVATMAFAQAPVTSVNVVGFNKLTLQRGGLYLISVAFEDIGTNALRAANVLGDQVPAGTKLTAYSSATGVYLPSDQRAAFGVNFGWGPIGGSLLFHGFMSFWLKIPSDSLLASYDVVLKGQVPDNQQISNVIVPGINQLGYPFTADVAFTNTALYATSAVGDRLILYSSAITNYLPAYTRAAFGPNKGWGAAASVVFRQGTGFWYRSASNSSHTVSENIPYTL